MLIGVTQARASANAIHLSPEDLRDPAKVEAYEKAQNGVTVALTQLRPLQEQYPDSNPTPTSWRCSRSSRAPRTASPCRGAITTRRCGL